MCDEINKKIDLKTNLSGTPIVVPAMEILNYIHERRIEMSKRKMLSELLAIKEGEKINNDEKDNLH